MTHLMPPVCLLLILKEIKKHNKQIKRTGDGFSFGDDESMYIGITVDLKNYNGEVFDLRISDFLSIKKVIEITWQIKKINSALPSGYWVKVENKDKVCSGYESLVNSGITNGDRLEIL